MTSNQKNIIKSTFKDIKANELHISHSFYNYLFEIAPDIKILFKGPIEEQGKKLMAILSIAVENIDDLMPLIPGIKELGIRHMDYGVKAEHYPIVGKALLWTFENELKEKFTAAAEEAWAELYDIVATTMQS